MHAIICCNLINAASPVEAVKPNNTEITPNVHYIQILCGRDDPQGMPGTPGIDGRDGEPGMLGEKGELGIQGLKGDRGEQGPAGGGVTYIRWGKTSCPSVSGTLLLYHGIAAGSWYAHVGGGANYLCMPHNPQYGAFQAGVQGTSPIYGTEYQPYGGPLGSHDHNVPCAVCYASTRVSLLMLPARVECPTSWTREYTGYLMSNYFANNHHRTMYECVDQSPDRIPGSAPSTDGAVFYHVEAACNGLPCGPYDPQKELTCAVCTK